MDKIFDTFLFESNKYKDISGSKKGVLRTIEGPLAEWDNKNRNNRVYSEGLWDRVLESDYLKEQTKYKTLYGEANHPSDRMEIDFGRVSHSITEMWKMPDKKEIHGRIDILDTPLGNILNVLYEYGSIPGFSSRAGGTLKQVKDHVEVEENSYQFITFDAVPFPSVASARPLSVGESVIPESIVISEEVRGKIKDIISNSSKKEREILRSFIYDLQEDFCIGFDEEIAILEGMENTTKEPVKDATLHLLKDSYRVSTELSNERQALTEQVSNLEKSLNENEKKMAGIEDRLVEIVSENESLKLVVTQQEEKIVELTNTLSEQSDVSEDQELLMSELEVLKEQNEELRSFYKKYKHQKLDEGNLQNENDELVKTLLEKEELLKTLESKSQSSEVVDSRLKDVEDKLTVAEDRNDFYRQELEELREEVQSMESKLEVLESEKESLTSKIDALKELNEGLEVELTNTSLVRDEAINEQRILEDMKINEVAVLKESLEQFKAERKEEVRTFVDQVTYYRNNLLESVCRIYGVPSTMVIEHLDENYKVDDVHEVCERLSLKVPKSPFIMVEGKTSKNENRLHDVYAGGSRRQ